MTGPIHDRGAYEDRESLIAQIGALRDELDRLRDRVSSHPHDIAMLERRLADARSDARTAANNERLAATLREARDQIVSLKMRLIVWRNLRPASQSSSPRVRSTPRTSSPLVARCASA